MKNIKYLFTMLLAFSLITSCDQDSELIEFDTVNGQTLAQFNSSSLVLATPEEGFTVDVEILVTTQSPSDRSITIEIDASSTATTDQYNISNLTIPAGTFIGTMIVSANFNALPEVGSSFLTVNLLDIENSDAVIEKGSVTFEFFRKCPLVLSEFAGTYSGTGSWSEVFGYTTEIVTFVDSNGDLWMDGIAVQWIQGWWGEPIVSSTPVKVDVLDAETGEFEILDQPYVETTFNGVPQTPYNVFATGTFLNTCEKTLEIFPILNQGGFLIDGTAWSVAFKETIKLD